MNNLQKRKISYLKIQKKLQNKKVFTVKIEGNSMKPFLKFGEKVHVLPNDKNYEFGDLVLIQWGKRYVIHRLINVKKHKTKGDNLSVFDPKGLKIICKICKYQTPRFKLYYKFVAFFSLIEGNLNKVICKNGSFSLAYIYKVIYNFEERRLNNYKILKRRI